MGESQRGRHRRHGREEHESRRREVWPGGQGRRETEDSGSRENDIGSSPSDSGSEQFVIRRFRHREQNARSGEAAQQEQQPEPRDHPQHLAYQQTQQVEQPPREPSYEQLQAEVHQRDERRFTLRSQEPNYEELQFMTHRKLQQWWQLWVDRQTGLSEES